MVYKLFNKNSALLADKSASGGAVKHQNISSQSHLDLPRIAKVSHDTQELAEDINKQIFRKF